MSLRNGLFVVAAVAALAGSAQGVTIATFADPAAGPGTPLFSYNAATGIFSGGWSGTGLNLLTPGVPAADFADATFVISPLTTTVALGPVSILSGGNVRFFDSSATEIFRIDFNSSTLTQGLSLGASDFVGSGVVFSGAIVPGGYAVSDEAFAFSFANPQSSLPTGSYTVTSSFTSSATLTIPAPASGAMLGLGAILAGRRRRKA